jgi:hypothetical protein
MIAFLLALARVAGVLLVASAAGWAIARALLPRGRAFRLEQAGWAFAAGIALLAAFVPLSAWIGARPGWVQFVVLAAVCVATSFKFRVSSFELKADGELGTRNSKLETLLLRLLVFLGIALYALRALTEPMWSNDFVAIWGLKGKSIALSGGLPEWMRTSPGFAHPEYPLGLPFLYAGIAFLSGGWDDHALALLFPLLQVATVGVALGWLRRHTVSPIASLLVVAILAHFEPLYSAFLTGLAEVPLAFGALLFGTALADALDPDEAGALRRLALAAAILAATKNEGLFLAAAGCALGLLFGGTRRWRIAAAALPTALLVHLLHRLWSGHLPLRDFDFALFSIGRLRESLVTAAAVLGPLGWIGLLLVAVLVVLGARRRDAGVLLALAAGTAATYLLLPAFAVRGPEWMVRTTLLRIGAALAPLVAAGVGLGFAGSARGAPLGAASVDPANP